MSNNDDHVGPDGLPLRTFLSFPLDFRTRTLELLRLLIYRRRQSSAARQRRCQQVHRGDVSGRRTHVRETVSADFVAEPHIVGAEPATKILTSVNY